MISSVTNPAGLCRDETARELVAAAFEAIARVYVPERHQIAAAALTSDGRIVLGVHLDAMVGRAAVCAEPAAVAAARLGTASSVVMIAAVRYPKPTEAQQARIVPPCGLCRELLLDHGAPGIRAVVLDGTAACPVPVSDLLPHKYVGTKWAGVDRSAEPTR